MTGLAMMPAILLLKQTAWRLTNALRRSDTVAQKLIDVIGQAIQIDSQGKTTNQYIGASICISIYPSSAQDIDSLINATDTAMYLAKKAGRNRYARM